MVTLPKGDLGEGRTGAAWLGDSKHIVFTGAPATASREAMFRRFLPARPSSDSGGCDPRGKSSGARRESVLGRIGGTWALFPIHGGDASPFHRSRRRRCPLQWSHGGRYVYTVTNAEGARPPAVDVSRVELATGVRTLWKTLEPSDPAGVEDMRETVVITPDAQSYCYSYMRRLGDLYVVEGLSDVSLGGRDESSCPECDRCRPQGNSTWIRSPVLVTLTEPGRCRRWRECRQCRSLYSFPDGDTCRRRGPSGIPPGCRSSRRSARDWYSANVRLSSMLPGAMTRAVHAWRGQGDVALVGIDQRLVL